MYPIYVLKKRLKRDNLNDIMVVGDRLSEIKFKENSSVWNRLVPFILVTQFLAIVFFIIFSFVLPLNQLRADERSVQLLQIQTERVFGQNLSLREALMQQVGQLDYDVTVLAENIAVMQITTPIPFEIFLEAISEVNGIVSYHFNTQGDIYVVAARGAL